MIWQPIETAPRDGTLIVIDPRAPDLPERLRVPGPVTARWGACESFAEFGEGWIVFEGRHSTVFTPSAVAWFPLPAASADTRPQGGDATEIAAPALPSGAVGSEADETPNPSSESQQ